MTVPWGVRPLSWRPRSSLLVWVLQGEVGKESWALALFLCVLVPEVHTGGSREFTWSERAIKVFP